MANASMEPVIVEYDWISILIALREEAARQLVLSGDPTARKVFVVLQTCMEEIFRDR